MATNKYRIDYTDPTKPILEIPPKHIVGPSNILDRQVDVDLVGMGSTYWGEKILENILHVLENFAIGEDRHTINSIVANNEFTVTGDVTTAFNTGRIFTIYDSTNNDGSYTVQSSTYAAGTTNIVLTTSTLVSGGTLGIAGEKGAPNRNSKFSPISPIEGQLWYNKTANGIFVYSLIGSPLTGQWRRDNGITFSTTQPAAPGYGDLWWDTSTYAPSSDAYGRNLHIYLGSWVKVVENYLPRDGSKAMQATLDMGSNIISNISNPVSANDGMNLSYADANYVNISGDTMTGVLNMGSNLISNVADPINPNDVVNLTYADTNYYNVSGDTMLGNMNMNLNNIDNSGNITFTIPTNPPTPYTSNGLTWSGNTDVTSINLEINNVQDTVLTFTVSDEDADYFMFKHIDTVGGITKTPFKIFNNGPTASRNLYLALRADDIPATQNGAFIIGPELHNVVPGNDLNTCLIAMYRDETTSGGTHSRIDNYVYNSNTAAREAVMRVSGPVGSFALPHIEMLNHRIRNLRYPALPADAATKSYVDNVNASSFNYTINSGVNYVYAFTNTGVFNDSANYFDIFPPAGKTMANLAAFIPSIYVIHFAGNVDANDSMRCTYAFFGDRIRVYVQNTEQRSAPAASWLAVWV